MLQKFATQALTLLPPEAAHRATIELLKAPISPVSLGTGHPMLRTQLAGMELPNPIGMAAGFDKNAEVPAALLNLGFGFVEVGAVTPRPQPGNPSPRVFRLRKDEAIINRYGFNNDGLDAIGERLKAQSKRPGVVGINLGANKDSEDRTEDYVTSLKALEPLVSFLTVNVSSPNTQGLRSLQGKEVLTELSEHFADYRAALDDLAQSGAAYPCRCSRADIAAAAMEAGVDGMIVSNTTLDREGLKSSGSDEAGGLSGRPLFEKSTAILRDFAIETEGKLPLVGVGGIFSAKEAFAKIKAGATAVQLYTALIYEGPGLIGRMRRKLPHLLQAEGFQSVSEAVGADL